MKMESLQTGFGNTNTGYAVSFTPAAQFFAVYGFGTTLFQRVGYTISTFTNMFVVIASIDDIERTTAEHHDTQYGEYAEYASFHVVLLSCE